MTTGPVYRRICRQPEIRPEVRGDLLLLLELPFGPALPIIREIYDPFGRRLPRRSRDQVHRRLQRIPAGIFFDGVAAEAVWELILWDPPLGSTDAALANYNAQMLLNACHAFLIDPRAALSGCPKVILTGFNPELRWETGDEQKLLVQALAQQERSWSKPTIESIAELKGY
jgi:hypothetical protein